jgi:uncharacterized coiled-coil DUF342 family protein
MSGDEVSKELQSELSNAEKRLKVLYEKRDHFQEEAKVFREMREDLHQKRRAVLDNMAELKGKKEALYAEIKETKARRDHYNEKAGILSGAIRKRRDDDRKNSHPYEDRSTLELELRKLETAYETNPQKDLAKERDLVKKIDGIRKKLEAIYATEPERQKVAEEVRSSEDEIEDFKRRADLEHARINELFGQIREIDATMKELYPSINHLRGEGDKRHEEYLKARSQADSYHNKAMELRERVLQLRDERRKIQNEARAVIDEQNRSVKAALDDGEKLETAADAAVELLLKKGKIRL